MNYENNVGTFHGFRKKFLYFLDKYFLILHDKRIVLTSTMMKILVLSFVLMAMSVALPTPQSDGKVRIISIVIVVAIVLGDVYVAKLYPLCR